MTRCRRLVRAEQVERHHLGSLPDRTLGALRIGGWSLHEEPSAFRVIPTPSFESLVCRLFRDGVQFCSGLVDLVVSVGRHSGGGHRFTLAGERFVGPVAEDVAEVGDQVGDFGDPRRTVICSTCNCGMCYQ